MARWTNVRVSHCLFYLDPLQTSRVFSSIHASKISHGLSPGCFQQNTHICSQQNIPPPNVSVSAKLIRQFPGKHHMTQLSLQRNQKFPTHLYVLCILQRCICVHTQTSVYNSEKGTNLFILVCVCVCIHACAHVRACTWRSKDDTRCLPLLSISLTEAVSLTEPRAWWFQLV